MPDPPAHTVGGVAHQGRITRIDRGRALVAVGEETHSVIDTGVHDLTVGDHVRFEGDVVVELLPRTSLLTRLGHDGNEQPIAANVDLYSPVLLDACAIPSSLFTATFAMARVVGWCAHVLEQAAEAKIIRPAAYYVGPPPDLA